MSSRKKHLVSQERITKRLLGRHNYDLLKPVKLTPKIVEHGGYKVRDAATGRIVSAGMPTRCACSRIFSGLDAS